jgi:hypothetical protein
MEPSAIVAILMASGSVLTGFITVLFHSMSLSRCKNIDCCCIRCDREVLTEETYRAEQVEARQVEQNP